MNFNITKQILAFVFFAIMVLPSQAIHSSELPSNIDYHFKVSVGNPNNHYYYVEFTCTNQTDDQIEFKMPAWTPGYYAIQNNCRFVVNFKARNEQGTPLQVVKTSKNTWDVTTQGARTVVVSYQVYANELSVVSSHLDSKSGFISPTSLFMYPEGQLKKPALVTVEMFEKWKNLSTGLDAVEGAPHTYFASDFDILFDCPILMGNHEVMKFNVKGIPHFLAYAEKDTLDKTPFIQDLTRIIEATTNLMGDIPYKHYTFITIGSMRGGLEHSNSCVLSCTKSVADTSNMQDYKSWLSFVAHEYFHLYNVKSIRPLVLGPFDYEKECYTNLLWLSEGITVYYENIILNRAGLMNQNECFKSFTESIANYENRPGGQMEAATESSFDAWIHFFDPTSDARNNTISYYDKGCALGLLLDLKIRHATKNKKSLDDVMRGLYNIYFKELGRGFTDEEFKTLCEQKAGIPLDEIFTYAKTVNPIDYQKYLSLAGLNIDTTSHLRNDQVYWGAQVKSDSNRCWLYNVERNGPAWKANLGNDIQIETVDGQDASKDTFEKILSNKKPGDKLTLTTSIEGEISETVIILETLKERTFQIENAQKTNIFLNTWLVK